MPTLAPPVAMGNCGLDVEAAAQAIAYIANRVPDAGYHKVSKLLYLAEREHLSRYGRMIVGDTFYALEDGPVPTVVYDALKGLAGRNVYGGDVAKLQERLDGVVCMEGWRVRPMADADGQWFSRSELECLDAVIAEHGHRSYGDLTNLTHDEAWESTAPNNAIALEAIVRTLPNADKVLAYLRGDEDE